MFWSGERKRGWNKNTTLGWRHWPRSGELPKPPYYPPDPANNNNNRNKRSHWTSLNGGRIASRRFARKAWEWENSRRRRREMGKWSTYDGVRVCCDATTVGRRVGFRGRSDWENGGSAPAELTSGRRRLLCRVVVHIWPWIANGGRADAAISTRHEIPCVHFTTIWRYFRPETTVVYTQYKYIL